MNIVAPLNIVTPITLEGSVIRLEPIRRDHAEDFWEIAKEEGTLRRHVITWTGRVRDSVYFSILDSEWPEVKQRLEARLRPGKS